MPIKDPGIKEKDGNIHSFPPFPSIFFLSCFIGIYAGIKRDIFKECGITMFVSTPFNP